MQPINKILKNRFYRHEMLNSGFYLMMVCVFFLSIMAISSDVSAAEYVSGYGALDIFDEQAMSQLPPLISLWLNVMMVIFALGLLFVWKYPIARWLVGGFILSGIMVLVVFPALNITVLSGLVSLTHLVFWSPGLYCMLKTRPFFKEL